MIIIKITCGMGNQMFMYAFARMLQDETGHEICLDYSDFGELSKNHNASFENTLKNFNIKKCKVITTHEEFFDIVGDQGKEYYKMKKKLDRLLKFTTKIGRYYKERWSQYEWNKKGFFFGRDSFIDIYPEAVETENIIAKGYWQSEKYFYHISDQIKSELMVCTKISDKNKKYLEEIMNSESVCVHIRRGDFVNSGKTHCSDNYYKKGIEFIKNKIPSAKFFVFSDDIAYVKTMPIFEKGTVFIDGANPPYEDLRLMYSCRHFIISNSSFSWWGQYLSSNQDKIVVAPKPWRGRFQSDLIQNEWYNIKVWD